MSLVFDQAGSLDPYLSCFVKLTATSAEQSPAPTYHASPHASHCHHTLLPLPAISQTV